MRKLGASTAPYHLDRAFRRLAVRQLHFVPAVGSLEDILVEILAFRREHPAAAAFSDALDQTARRIQHEFEGATREALLAEVGATLERQARVSRDTRAALAAVDELAAALQRLATLLDRAVRRPPGTTLH